MTVRADQVCYSLKAAMACSDDLLTKEWYALTRNAKSVTAGHCYIAAEAAYHALGGKAAGLVSYVARCPWGGTHWWVETLTGVKVDPTAEQYTSEGLAPPYHLGRRCGFLTSKPSKRAAELLRRAGL